MLIRAPHRPHRAIPWSNAGPRRGAPRELLRNQLSRSVCWFRTNCSQVMYAGYTSRTHTGQSATARTLVLAFPVAGERSYGSYSFCP